MAYNGKTKRALKPALLSLAVGTSLIAGCTFSTSMTYTFTVETGDSVEIEMDTTTGYALDADQVLYKGNDKIGALVFMPSEQFQKQLDISPTHTDITDYKKVEYHGHEGVYYETASQGKTQYCYFMTIADDAGCGLGLYTLTSEQDASNVLNALEFQPAGEENG